MRNAYEVCGDIVLIYLKCRGSTEIATISISKLEKVMSFKGTWYGKFDHNRIYVYGIKREGGVKRTISLHRFITDAPNGTVVDHINHSSLNNTDDNLRVVTHAENMQNRKSANSMSKSGVRGVTWNGQRNTWLAYVYVKGKRVWSRNFHTLEDAAKAVEEARAKYMPYSQQ